MRNFLTATALVLIAASAQAATFPLVFDQVIDSGSTISVTSDAGFGEFTAEVTGLRFAQLSANELKAELSVLDDMAGGATGVLSIFESKDNGGAVLLNIDVAEFSFGAGLYEFTFNLPAIITAPTGTVLGVSLSGALDANPFAGFSADQIGGVLGTVAPVPLPAALPLAALAFGGLAAFARRRA